MIVTLQRKKSVLLVDDNSGYRQNLRNFLTRSFPELTILESPDGRDGYVKITRQKFDLIVTEVKLPRMDGDQLLKALKDVPPAFQPQRVLVFSNLMPATPNLDAKKLVSYLNKSADQEILLEHIRKVFEELTAEEAKRSNVARVEGPKLDAALIQALIEGISFGFSSLVGLPLGKGRAAVATGKPLCGDIAGCFPLSGSGIQGRIVIAFPKGVYLAATNKITGSNFENLQQAGAGLAKELTQRTFHHAMASMGQKGMSIQLAEAEIVLGQNGTIQAQPDGVRIAVQMDSTFAKDPITLEIQLLR